MNDVDDKIRYQEAGKWFLHASSLRRTTVALVFTATGASIGLVRENILNPADFWRVFPLAVVNLLLVSAGFFQENQLRAYQRTLAEYMRKAENGSGPYSATYSDRKSFGTHESIVVVIGILFLWWSFVSIFHLSKSYSQQQVLPFQTPNLESSMTNTLLVVFTAIIAMSTIVYTVYSARLWKATRASVDISRYVAFMNLMLQLNQQAEEAKRKGLPEAALLEQFGNMLAEFGFERFLDDIDFKKDKYAIEYFSKIEGMIRGFGVDPNNVSWFRPVLRKLRP